MTWNWSRSKKAKVIRQKPDLHADGQNSKELVDLAHKYIRAGYTRQKAFARARAELQQPFDKQPMRELRGGSASSK